MGKIRLSKSIHSNLSLPFIGGNGELSMVYELSINLFNFKILFSI